MLVSCLCREVKSEIRSNLEKRGHYQGKASPQESLAIREYRRHIKKELNIY